MVSHIGDGHGPHRARHQRQVANGGQEFEPNTAGAAIDRHGDGRTQGVRRVQQQSSVKGGPSLTGSEADDGVDGVTGGHGQWQFSIDIDAQVVGGRQHLHAVQAQHAGAGVADGDPGRVDAAGGGGGGSGGGCGGRSAGGGVGQVRGRGACGREATRGARAARVIVVPLQRACIHTPRRGARSRGCVAVMRPGNAPDALAGWDAAVRGRRRLR